MEIWKDIQGYEGRYQISNYGRVKCFYRNKNGDELKVKTSRTGYKVAKLTKNGKRKWMSVHRLVAMAFIPPYSGEQVNHIDADKTNNHVENLEWCTAKENTLHAIKLGLFDDSSQKLAEANMARRKAVEATNIDTGEIIKFISMREAARMLNIDRKDIYRHLKGLSKRVKRYKICYC